MHITNFHHITLRATSYALTRHSKEFDCTLSCSFAQLGLLPSQKFMQGVIFRQPANPSFFTTNFSKISQPFPSNAKSLCGENPDPGRAQGLCRENRKVAEVPERTTIALISYLKIDRWSSFKWEMCTISNMMFISWLKSCHRFQRSHAQLTFIPMG